MPFFYVKIPLPPFFQSGDIVGEFHSYVELMLVKDLGVVKLL